MVFLFFSFLFRERGCIGTRFFCVFWLHVLFLFIYQGQTKPPWEGEPPLFLPRPLQVGHQKKTKNKKKRLVEHGVSDYMYMYANETANRNDVKTNIFPYIDALDRSNICIACDPSLLQKKITRISIYNLSEQKTQRVSKQNTSNNPPRAPPMQKPPLPPTYPIFAPREPIKSIAY